MRQPLVLLLFISSGVFAQGFSPIQQKALNNYMEYADKSVEEMSAIVVSVIKYYPSVRQHQGKSNVMTPRYSFPVQLENYYYTKAVTDSKALPASIASTLQSKLASLKEGAEKIDATCKALDTYHKLEDYKRDNFDGALQMIQKFPSLLKKYGELQDDLITEVETAYRILKGSHPPNAYEQASALMRHQMTIEKSFIDVWKFNLEENIPTGWPVEKLEASILETDKQLKASGQTKPSVKYPASSMVSSFLNGLASILDSKRNALDEYNAEARKTDRHSNDVYVRLINYYNGTLVSFYNSFIQYAQQDGYYGLKAVRYLPVFEIRTNPETVKANVQPFKDEQHTSLKVPAQPTPLPANQAIALNNYVEFINECLRQTNILQMGLKSFSSSAAYYKGLNTLQGKGQLRYDYKSYKVPLSMYQKTLSESSILLPAYAKSLNTQAEVILTILKEMEQLSVVLETETMEKRYEQDRLNHVYEILERYRFLYETLDIKKEQLYQDVRLVYDAYPVNDPDGSWAKSWQALRTLVDYDHAALFQAKEYYKGTIASEPQTNHIDEQLRKVLEKEYENMKGIQKLGRYNGLCPYTPYEDIPKTSRSFSEKLQKVSESKPSYSRHPYNDLIYFYNSAVNDYNKFCELSKLNFLKTIRQPEFFEIKYPDREGSVMPTVPDKPVTETTSKPPPTSVAEAATNEKVKLVRDTVYIEKRDTIYLVDPGEDLRSMEGYASNNMILLLDVSGSMNAPDRLPLLKAAVLDMLSMMRQEDHVAIVVYSGRAKVLLPPTSFKDEAKIRKAVDELTSSGKTDGNAGIKLAYEVADKNYIRGGNNRIILATDGEFSIGVRTFSLVEKFAKEDIFLSVFNFGKGYASAKNLQKLSGSGRGNYEYITKENMELKLIREAKSKRKR